MKKIIAFAGSNSKTSINKQLVTYAANFLDETTVEILDLNDFDLPLFGVDLEKEKGIPKKAHEFLELIKASDGIMLSLAEHNGAYSTAFKNLFDWMSRIESKTFFGKPILLMAASPGGRGGASVLEIAQNRLPFHNTKITGVFSLPHFGDKFKKGKIIDAQLDGDLKEKVQQFENILHHAGKERV